MGAHFLNQVGELSYAGLTGHHLMAGVFCNPWSEFEVVAKVEVLKLVLWKEGHQEVNILTEGEHISSDS